MSARDRLEANTAVVEQARIEDPAAVEAAERAARHRAIALRALSRGRGYRWAADITTFSLRFIVSVANTYGIDDATERDTGCLRAGPRARGARVHGYTAPERRQALATRAVRQAA